MSNCDDPIEDQQDIDNLDDSQKDETVSCEPIPKLPNFLTQVLYSIQQLKTKLRRGVSIAEISTFMKDNFNITGDVWSRVETAVAKAHQDGFLMGEKSKYTLVAPLARVQNAKSHDSRQRIAKELHKVFLYKSNLRKRKRSKSGKSSRSKCKNAKKSCRKQKFKKKCTRKGNKKAGSRSSSRLSKQFTKDNILAVLHHIEDVLLKDKEEEAHESQSEEESCHELKGSNMKMSLGGQEKEKAAGSKKKLCPNSSANSRLKPGAEASSKVQLKAIKEAKSRDGLNGKQQAKSRAGCEVTNRNRSKTGCNKPAKDAKKCKMMTRAELKVMDDSMGSKSATSAEESEASKESAPCQTRKRCRSAKSVESKSQNRCTKKRKNDTFADEECNNNSNEKGGKKMVESCLAGKSKRGRSANAAKIKRDQPNRRCKFASNT